jgi:hypothetical protein
MDAAAVDAPVVDAVSQAGRFVALGEESEAAPKLATRKRRRATTGAASARVSVTAKLARAEELAEAAEAQEVASAEPETPELRLTERALLQDEYTAFGVNGVYGR